MFRKIVLFIITTFLFIIISIFGIGEVVFRAVKPARPAISLGKPHPVFHHFYQPNYKGAEGYAGFPTAFSINCEGFRGRDFPLNKPNGVYRIVILGDSFAFGTAVNDAEVFSVLLEENLNKTAVNKKYEVINCGIASYSPILEYLLLKYKVIAYRPDLVMLFYDFSDLQEDTLYARHALFDKNGEITACNPFYINGHLDYVQLLRKHFHFFSHIHNKLSDSFKKIRLLGLRDYLSCNFQGKKAKGAIMRKTGVKSAEFDRYFIFRENMDKKIIRYYWKNSQIWLDKIKGLLDANGIEFILVAYPYGLQVSKSAWQEGRATWQFEKNKLYGSPVPFEMFYEYSRKKNVKFANLWQYLLRHSAENLYYDFDGHWTALGNKRVMEGIFNDAVFIASLED